MSFQRAVTPLRDTRRAERLACLGCDVPTGTRGSWAICFACQEKGWAWIRARAPKEGAARRMAFNQFWGDRVRVAAAIREMREGVGA